jgi:hypothetical protein
VGTTALDGSEREAEAIERQFSRSGHHCHEAGKLMP